jgi:hypothetical protein
MAHVGVRRQPRVVEEMPILSMVIGRWRTCAHINLAEGVGFETGVRAVLMRTLPRCVPVLPERLTRIQRASS